MTTDEAANILGIDDADTMEDLEDILDLDGRWAIADLERAAEILDGEGEDDQDDEDDPAEDDD